MSTNTIFSRLERIYLAVCPAFGSDGTITIPSFSNTNYCRHIKLTLDNDVSTLIRRDKTGARTATIGVKGREYCKWSYEGSLAPSGTNDVPADFDPLMQALYNGPAVSGTAPGGAITGLVYGPFVDQPNTTLAIASYRQPSTVDQRIGFGLVVSEATFNLGQDIAEWTCSGTGKFVIDSDYLSTASADEAGGLSGSFPTEPSAPVSHGGIIAGFTGSFKLNGSVVSRIRTATIKISTQNVMVRDTFGHYTPDDTMGDVRMVTIQFSLYEDDSAGQQALRNASITKTPLDADITVGTFAGSIVNVFMKNIQLASPTRDDSSLRYQLNWPESRAFGTSLTSKDEVTITLA